MTENRGKWPSGHQKTEKSGHRLAAEKTLFPRRWYGGMISANLEVIWEMSVKDHVIETIEMPELYAGEAARATSR